MNTTHRPSFTRRALLAAAALCVSLPALAQTPIKSQFDWRFEGPAALFLASAAKGDYQDAKLYVTIDAVVASPDARAEGFGQVVPGRLALMASQVSEAFNTKTRVDPNAAWTDALLPSKAELNILPAPRK